LRASKLTTALKAEIDQYNDWVDEHPMMKAEIAKQLDDLAVIRETPSLSADFLDRLKESSSGCGIQPFVRGLLPQSPGYRKRNSKRARS
jgi:transcription elongation factor Elf1